VAALLKPSKADRTSLYQISKLSHSLGVVFCTTDLVNEWSRPRPITDIEELRQFLKQPLLDVAKVPLSQQGFDDLCVPWSLESPHGILCHHDLLSLFRSDDQERAYIIRVLIAFAIAAPTPSTGTAELFHMTYDTNISRIFQIILPHATPIRNSNHNTSTALKQPDYGLLVKGHCIFRGEETGSDSSGDPKQELIEKIVRWEYDPLPYILGLL